MTHELAVIAGRLDVYPLYNEEEGYQKITPDSVRAELYKILAEARAAERLPWEPRTVLLYRTIFPQMTNWLPDEEGAQLRFEFDAEIRGLEAA